MSEYVHSCPNCMAVLSPSDSKLPPFDPSLVSSDILETNDPPLESQIPFLRDFVARGRARMDVLNPKIALLQSALDELLEERDKLDIEIREHKGGLSPLRRMPTEILSHIFSLVLRPSESAPWTVSAVCARWRTTVISQPSFWASIHYHHDHSRSIGTNTFRLETQLCRSKELPLNVEFSVLPEYLMRPNDLDALKIVCKHAGRWEMVSLSGPEALYLRLWRFLRDQLRLLRELTIEIMHDQVNSEAPSLNMFKDAPLLQRVIVNKQLWLYPVTMVLPWSQILRYGGTNTWDGHLHSLGVATNLVDCSLEICDESSVPQILILLPHLLRLSLSDPAFLECLDTPALVELYCNYAPPVLPFLHRQQCKLRTLVMWKSSLRVDPTELTRIVDAIPTVATLGILFPLPAAFVHDFHSRPDGIAPALEHIHTVLARKPPDVQDHFLEVIEARRQSGRLKSVKVHSPEFAPNILERMELLRAQGMEFRSFLGGYDLRRYVIPSDMYIESKE
ncbi:hypothetical protein B0H13DRAFT_2269015 [Mycena leptocephala]|nr:hypothetical protein B0H13DRAFT_2269015 [Mycena leptocephala]